MQIGRADLCAWDYLLANVGYSGWSETAFSLCCLLLTASPGGYLIYTTLLRTWYYVASPHADCDIVTTCVRSLSHGCTLAIVVLAFGRPFALL